MLVYPPMLVLVLLQTPLMPLMFHHAIIHGLAAERFDVGYFCLSLPLMYVSMTMVRRRKERSGLLLLYIPVCRLVLVLPTVPGSIGRRRFHYRRSP